MTKLRRILIPNLILALFFGSVAIVNAAPPGLPSSFYGEIHFMAEDGGPSAGNTIDAYVPGVASSVASAVISTYDTDLVYHIDVPADDLATTSVKEGGQEGEIVSFKVGGRIVADGIWHSGSNVAINIHPPKANPGGPYVAVANEEVTFSGSATDWSTTDTFTFAWDLDNDGTFEVSTSQSPAHTFTTTGIKTINLKVTDSQNGEGFASTDVVVIDLSGLSGQVYDGTGKSVTVTGVGAPYTYAVTYDDLPTLPINADSYSVDIDISDDGTATGTVTKTMVISPKSASVTPDPKSKIYGDADPSLSGILSGFLGGDGVSATYSRTEGQTVAGSPYTISATLSPTNVLGNYDITYNTANFTINPKAASVTPDPKSKIYGDSEPSLSGSLSGFLAGDGVSATYSRTAGETVAGSPYSISATLTPARRAARSTMG